MTSDNAPFYAGSTISQSWYFIGYQEQLNRITNRTISGQPTSINIVGDKRVGKSSLLYHFCQIYEQLIESRNQKPRNYLAVYISLQQGNCNYKSGFYQVIAEHLSDILEKRFKWFNQPRKLINLLNTNNFNTEKFNDSFYNNLRSLMDGNALMLVIASEKDLKIYSEEKKLTSAFFNLGHVIPLEGFTDAEAQDLVRLPQTTTPGNQAVLNENEQETALEWGGNNPYLLQLAGLYLWEAKQNNESLELTKKRFDRQVEGIYPAPQVQEISPNHTLSRKGLLLFKYILWTLPKKLGSMGRFIGANLGDVADGIIGWGLMGLVVLILCKIVPIDSIIEAVKNVLGLGD
jgi:AAA+ ATPase superfamily predicted ATPase